MMEFIRTVLISLALLPLWGEAAFMKDHSESAVSLLLRSKGPNKVKTKDLVASLGEVAKSLQTEDKKAYELSKKSKSECKATGRDLDMSLKKGERAFNMATDDYQKTDAQVRALSASLAELKGQIQGSNSQLDSLQAQLKRLRRDQGLLKSGAASSLRQVEAVIAKTYLRESNAQHRRPSSLEKKVSSLEELSKSLSVSFMQTDSAKKAATIQKLSRELSFLQSDSDEEEEISGEEQMRSDTADASKEKQHAPVLILKTDKQAVVTASRATQKGFNEEEKRLLDLVEVERKKLQDLEDNLQDMQPAVSNKLKQALEINRTRTFAERGTARDKKLMAVEGEKCTVVEDNLAKQRKSRASVLSDVQMASKVIEHMDTGLFLSKDLQGLKQAAPASFLQMSESFSAVRAAPSLLQESEGMGLEELVENYGSSVSEGPFDSVTKMLSGLIASLKAQANEEVNQHQFCQDSIGKNRRDRIAKKNSIDTLTSTIRWSGMAIVRIDDDLKYTGAEISRLAEVQTIEATELTAETTRVNKELADHKLADEVVTKATVILAQLCDLTALAQEGSSSDTALIQQHKSKVGSRFSQCKEASDLLKSASKEIKALDVMTGSYLTAFTQKSNAIKGDAQSAQNSRKSQETSSKAGRAQRASELATANKDVKEAQKELKLIDDAKKELEHSCSHVETREEKMARRQDQIDALKEALNVLNGEAIPA